MPRTAAPQVPQLFDSFLTMQQEIWEQSFRLLSAYARPTPRDAQPAARDTRKAKPSSSRERPNASAGGRRRARVASRGKRS